MAYGTEIKAGNITENWLFRLGFFNGKGNGNGDGAFSKVTQSDGSLNQVKVSISILATSIDIDDSLVFDTDDFIKINNEVMKVTGLTDGDTITVLRGQKGTTPSTHSVNAQIYWHNYLSLSFTDDTDNNTFYHGAILNRPSIRESINLVDSTSQSSNLSITIPDFTYKGTNVSQELFGGTHKYINQEAKVYVKVNNQSKVQIQVLRITDISTSGDKISISLISSRPWDYTSIPQTKTNTTNRYFPIAYGSYDNSTNSTISSADFCTNKSLFPVPVDKFGSGICVTLHPHSSSVSDAKVFYYEKNVDAFCPVYRANLTYPQTTVAYEGGYANKIPANLLRALKFRPDEEDDGNEWDDPTEAFDGVLTGTNYSEDTSGELTAGTGESSSATKSYKASIPQLDGKCNTFKQTLNAQLDFVVTGNVILGTTKTFINDETYSRGAVISSNFSLDGTDLSGGSASYGQASTGVINAYTESGNLPERVRFDLVTELVANTGSCTARGTAKIWDIECQAEMQVDPDVDKKSSSDIKYLYSGADGLPRSWSSGACDEIQEAHLDLLIRFAGLTQADGSAISDPTDDSQVDGWGALDTARDGWDIRWWTDKESDLLAVLQKMAKEGGFIFRFKHDGTPQYIHIPDSPSTDYTLSKNDISNININTMPFSDLITKRKINYQKHPAENRYIQTLETEDTTNNIRKKYNIKEKENIEEVNLDMLVGDVGDANCGDGNPNDSFANYYYNITGDIKLIVNCDIVNTSFYDIEVGSIIEFDENNMFPETPMGHNLATWNNLKMMVTSTNRTLGKLSITAREI